MRYVTAGQYHKCPVCKEMIHIGEICIQSIKGRCFYHESCHNQRYGDSWIFEPTNERPK
jgi:hypothetical protein